MLKDFKFKPADFEGKNIKALENTVRGRAEWLKARFDNVGENIIALGVNNVIDTLAGSSGAASIGAIGGGTVQDHLDSRANPHLVTKEQLGLDRVNNTSDMEKPISQQTQQEINMLRDNVLTKDNVLPYEPTENYHPVTLKKLNDAQFQSGSVSAVFGQGGNITELDCGDWDMSEIERHNRSRTAHSSIIVDGGKQSLSYDSDTLEEHKVNENVHGNVIISGGEF